MRKFCLKIHRWLAIPFGIFFSILSFTGMLLVFRHEIATLCGVSNDYELAFFRIVQGLHQNLLIEPTSHDGMSIGKFIIGITALCSILILISGIVIWWPQNKTMLKNRFSLHFHQGWRRFVYDSHVSLGIYAVMFLLLMALTGPTMSFSWYNKAVTAVVGMKSNTPEMHPSGPQQSGARFGLSHQQSAFPQAGHDMQGLKFGGPGHHGPMGAHGFFMQIHGGQWAGFIGEIIYFLSALIGGFLPISGYYLWWKKQK